MNIGIIAAEFPPAVGGMENHAHGLASALAAANRITVFTKLEHASFDYRAPYAVKPVLAEKLMTDKQRLANECVDFWLVLNAAYAHLSLHLDAPVFVYCHGNDFLQPWPDLLKAHESVVVNGMKNTPYLWRHAASVKRRVERRKIAAGLTNAKAVFTNSYNTKQLLSHIFPRMDTPILVNYPGVSDRFFSNPAHAESQPNKAMRILTVARLSSGSRRKNVAGVLRALARISDEIPFVYTVVGDGDIRKELTEMSEALGISDKTRFTGSVSNAEIIANMDASDLFILASKASRTDIEGFGIVYIEAAARGLPSLAASVGGATEAIADKVSGIVIDGAKPDDIAQGIRDFYRLRNRFNTNDIREFANRFRWSNVAGEMEAAIQAAMMHYKSI